MSVSPLVGSSKVSTSDGCLSCPSAPSSFGSWIKNRVLSAETVIVSAVTVVASVVSLAVPCGSWTERALRFVLSVGTTLHGIRQFLYTTDREEKGLFGNRARVILQIGNIPAIGEVSDMRTGMLMREAIGKVWVRIFCPGYGVAKDPAEAIPVDENGYDPVAPRAPGNYGSHDHRQVDVIDN